MTNRRSHLLVLLFILVALGGVALLALPQSPLTKSPVLGLDLQGGLQVTLQADPPPGAELTDEDLDRSVTIIQNRIDRLGVAEPQVARQANNQISVQIPGVRDADRARELIGKTAQLEFYDLEANLVPPSITPGGDPVAADHLFDVLSPVQSQVEERGARAWFLFERESKALRAGPLPTEEAIRGTAAFEELGEEDVRIFGLPEERIVLRCGAGGAVVCPGVQELRPQGMYFYLFQHHPDRQERPVPEMTGEHLELGGTRADYDQNSQPIVLMQFTDEGRDRFAEVTREIAQRGRLRSIGGEDRLQHFAIVLDNEIRSWPTIDFRENPNGIRSPSAQITGMAGVREAQELAIVLQTGALPVRFQTLEEAQVSATLGDDSLRQALRAAIAGLLLVVLFFLVFYRFLGLVAVIGLGIYAAFLYGAILLFNVTLTLPGFAGMILTIGVAADANIVIFERIKEEYRAGKSVRAAIAAGYSKGFNTIVDANVVTAITAMVLFLVATAGVRGFALMLLVGIAISMITAVLATRAMLGILSGFRFLDRAALIGAAGPQRAKFLQVDFIGKRRAWFAFSGVLLTVAFGALALNGLNLGIDFRGGTQVTFTTPQPVSLGEIRQEAAEVGRADAQIQGRGSATGTAGDPRYTDFQLRMESLPAAEQTRFVNTLRNEFQAETNVTTVSGTFGRQIATSALWAIFFSFLLIVLYISIRFQWKFSIPVIVALLHDVFITVGIYSLTGRQVTTATVAAVLTVLGYSVYDTIIIFDRVRENLGLMRRASFARIANVSLWETIRRSLATTLSTLLPVGALFFFGGETLKDFAFALLVGIGAGAYSSIFVATPLLVILREREPEFARRRDDASQDGKVLEEAQELAADAPVPALAPLTPSERAATNAEKRERRRQRRRTRPHGRAR